MKRFIAIIVVVIMIFALSACAEYDNNIDNYYSDVSSYEADLFMPDLDAIGNYVEIEYLCKKAPVFFPEYLMQLIVKYDEETFLKEKERLEIAYTYIDEPQESDYGDGSYTIPVAKFSKADFDFKIAKFEDTVYPKNFGMIGVSDENHEIAYLWSYFPDLDTICESYEDRDEEMLKFIDSQFTLK